MNPLDKKSLKIGVGYIRESTEKQDSGYSPEHQENSIRQYAKSNNIQIIEIYKDLESGTSVKKRDDFQKMIDDALQHKFEIILVFHTSRFARNIKEARDYKQLLRQKLNIDVVSVTQNFGDDWKNPSAFLTEGINELFDEHYSRQLSFWLRHSLSEKRRQGFQRGNPPLGYYKKSGDTKNWYIDPKESKIVREAFELYATGKYSFVDITVQFNSKGYRTKQENEFTYSSIKYIISNRVYLGFIPPGRKKLPETLGNHKAIIEEELFDKCQEIRLLRRRTIGRPVAQHRFYLLQGLLYCYSCIKHLKGKEEKPFAPLLPRMYCETHSWKKPNGKSGEGYYYCCKFQRENKSCNQPKVQTKIIDKQVTKLMEGLQLPEDIIYEVLEKLKSLFARAKESKEGVTQIEKLMKERERINLMYRIGELTEEDYSKEISEIKNKLQEYKALNIVVNRSKEREENYIKETEKFLRDFKTFWKDLDDKEKRNWIQMFFKRIWVKGNKVVAIEPNNDFKPLCVALKKFLVQIPSATLRLHSGFDNPTAYPKRDCPDSALQRRAGVSSFFQRNV
ncbi:MAG: recombinase family protein [Patescibacteria group bacterium]